MKINPELFRGYNVRGIYPKEVNEELFEKIGQALARLLKKGKVVVGYDARLSSPQLYQAVIKGLQAAGHKLRLLEAGFVTTPMLYFLVGHLKAAGGVNITASHNPKEYNGLKIMEKDAKPIHAAKILKMMKKKYE
jgi:phosphomannomutase